MLAPEKLGLMTKEEASRRADELLERVGLPDKADAYQASYQAVRSRELPLQELWQNPMSCCLTSLLPLLTLKW